MDYLMGIDVGTTGVKVLLIDKNGNVVSKDTQEYPLYTPKPGWAEQNPEDWWNATVKGIKNVINNINPGDIKGIGLSGQMHGLVVLDCKFKVLRPSILWCDQRTVKQCEYITKKVGYAKLMELVCNPALTGFTAGKILWVRDNEPEIYKKIYKILLPKDYIRFKLTNVFATEVSDASGMLLLDIRKRRWSEDILKILNLSKDLLPDCFESEDVTGVVTKEVSKITGLKEGTPVVGGGGDQSSSAIGCGIVESGIISITIGTSGVVFAFSDEVKLDKLGRIHTFCHSVRNKWHTMGVMLSAGGSLKWFKDNLSKKEIEEAKKKKVDPYDVMLKEVEKIKPGAENLIFLPYLAGERTPHLDPYARGVFFGLGIYHKKSHLIRSILEGVSFGLRDSIEIMKILKIPIRQVRVTGGGARSLVWLQILADICNLEMVTVNVSEGAAFGVALLAGVGTRVYSDIKQVCRNVIKITNKIKPDLRNVKIYDEYYKMYKRMYLNLKKEFKMLSELK